MNTASQFNLDLNEETSKCFDCVNVYPETSLVGAGHDRTDPTQVTAKSLNCGTQLQPTNMTTSLAIQSGRVTKTRKRGRPRQPTSLERAKMEADEARESYKAQRTAEAAQDMNKRIGKGEAFEVSEEVLNARKYDRRLKMNRRSAAASRIRQNAYIKSLEKHLLALEAKVDNMCQELEAVADENTNLKSMLSTNVQQTSSLLVPSVPTDPYPLDDLDAILGDLPDSRRRSASM